MPKRPLFHIWIFSAQDLGPEDIHKVTSYACRIYSDQASPPFARVQPSIISSRFPVHPPPLLLHRHHPSSSDVLERRSYFFLFSPFLPLSIPSSSSSSFLSVVCFPTPTTPTTPLPSSISGEIDISSHPSA